MFTFLFTKKGENVMKFATQPYGISLSLFKVAAKLPDEGIPPLCSQSSGARENLSPAPFQLQNRARAPIYSCQFPHKS